jgi:hypothetical protein
LWPSNYLEKSLELKWNWISISETLKFPPLYELAFYAITEERKEHSSIIDCKWIIANIYFFEKKFCNDLYSHILHHREKWPKTFKKMCETYENIIDFLLWPDKKLTPLVLIIIDYL